MYSTTDCKYNIKYPGEAREVMTIARLLVQVALSAYVAHFADCIKVSFKASCLAQDISITNGAPLAMLRCEVFSMV